VVRGPGEYDKHVTVRLPSRVFEELKKRGLNVSALTRNLLESYLKRGADEYSMLAAELREVKRRIEENILKVEENMQRIGELETQITHAMSTVKEAAQKIRELETQTSTSLSILREALQKIGELEEALAKKQLERRLWLKGLMWEQFKDFFDETAEAKFQPWWIKYRLEGLAFRTGLSLEEVEEIFRETFPENCLVRRVFEKQKSL